MVTLFSDSILPRLKSRYFNNTTASDYLLWILIFAILSAGLTPVVMSENSSKREIRITEVNVRIPDQGLRMGAPFFIEINSEAPGAVSWKIPDTPCRVGGFTLKNIRVEPINKDRNSQKIVLEIQAFQTGKLDVPYFPIYWSIDERGDIPFRYQAVAIEVKSVLSEAQTDYPAPKPPRAFMHIPGENISLFGILVLSLLGLLGLSTLFLRMKQRKKVPEKPEALEEKPGVNQYLLQLEHLWVERTRLRDQRILTGLMMHVFRDYLSWRFCRDMHAMTNQEIYCTVLEESGEDGELVEKIASILRSGDEVRFSPQGGTAHTLLVSLQDMIILLGARPETEDEFAVPQVS